MTTSGTPPRRRSTRTPKIATPDELQAVWSDRKPEPDAWTPRPWVSVEERAAFGRSTRQKSPRSGQGAFEPAAGRDPVGIVLAQEADRLPELLPLRHARMGASAFAFYRGAAAVMAFDLSTTPRTDILVQASGDAHLSNFGLFASPERELVFDANDFDETLAAPWEWDVKRLAASIALAARSIGLSDDKARDCAVSSTRSYREHMRRFCRMDPLRVWYTDITVNDFIRALPKAVRKREAGPF